MKILILESNQDWIYGLPNGFCDAGHEVMISGPLTEKNIPIMIAKFKPNLIFSMGWTSEHTLDKLQWISKYVKESMVPYIFWATEDPGNTFSFSLPFIKITQPNFVFTVCPERIDFYRKLGIKAAYLDFGYHESIHHPFKLQNEYKAKLSVVANGYAGFLKDNPNSFRLKSIKTLILPLLKENNRIDFWGSDWECMNSILGYDIPTEWIHGRIPYIEASKVYSSADIIIGIQNHNVHGQVTQRTYEVLGSGGFLLTSDIPIIRRLFNVGQDLIVSSNEEDTIKLVNYYIENKTEREKIRKSGQMTVEKYSYKHRAEYIMDILKQEGIISD